jgi:hypothetical protein
MRALAAIGLGILAGCAANGLFGGDLVSHPAMPDRGLYGLAALVLLGVLSHLVLLRRRGMAALRISGELLVLVVLPIWGFLINRALPTCQLEPCGDVWKPLAVPQIYGVYAAHTLAAFAYLIARRRPESLRPWLELLVPSLLVLGAVVDAVVAVHFFPLHLYFVVPKIAIFFPVAGLPLIAPSLSTFLFARLVYQRLRRRGEEALMHPGTPSSWPRVLAASPLLLGAYAIVHAILLHDPLGALQVFTLACSGTFATVHPPATDCHYLCTVAAQGHPWLVRPERLGRRRGATIIVNRQLAIANAFEDLLHERWPRFGRLARRTYDRLGLPVSRLIRRRWLADAVYLAMKPAEWAFYLALLVLDRRSPEERIHQMYR